MGEGRRLVARAVGHHGGLRRTVGRARAGSAVACPGCGATYSTFFSQLDDQCWNCGALPRHRQVALLFHDRPELLRPGMRVLHVAPEPAVRRLLPHGTEYVAGDLHPRGEMARIDITGLDFADESFDAVICNHVMEHVPDDRAAMGEVARVLRLGGWAILMTPILRPATDEDPAVTDPRERTRRWGQHDHVRRYGWDYVERLERAGLSVEVVDAHRPEQVRRYALNNRQGFVEPLFLATR